LQMRNNTQVVAISEPRVAIGITGLDNVLHGGLPSGHVYLVEGDPGAGKTTLGLQFLLEGHQHGDRALYVTLAESRSELEKVARSHGFDISKVEIFEVAPPELAGQAMQEYTVFHPSEVELADVMQSILNKVQQVQASRIVIDSMSEIRMLARDPLRYRRQILTLKQFFVGQNSTVLLLDDRTGDRHNHQLQSIAHGVIRLENLPREYGAKRRQLEVLKMRASQFREGLHDYVIRKGGLVVFPRLIAREHKSDGLPPVELKSGITELDRLLGGGITKGTSTLLMGPAGIGKSTVCAKFLTSAAERGEAGILFTFDESPQSLLARCRGLGIPLESHIKSGKITVEQLDPAELSPGEFVHRVRRAADEHEARIIVIDSLNGLLNAMQQERLVIIQLHEMLSYLSHIGVSTFLVLAQYGVLGSQMGSPIDVSYVADNVVLFRYFEASGAVKQAISVVKRRSGVHERTIRELVIAPNRIEVGEALHHFQGILTGVPRFVGDPKSLI
jgi:circadian clock protein KaiC